MASWRARIVGGGKIGQMIAELLDGSPNWEAMVLDHDQERLAAAAARGRRVLAADARDEASMRRGLEGADCVVNAAPFFLTPAIAAAAKDAGAHYFDLTEDVGSTQAVRALADGASSAFMPQCGLAPGFVGMVGASLAREFERLDSLSLRVGALPLFPTNALKYNLTWSTDGLINEYCNPCEAIVDGERTSLAPLDNLERISIDGVDYECFNTSGGLGALAESLDGKARAVSYRTIRYPGHRDILRLLLHDLGLERRRDLLRQVFDEALPRTDQDVVLVFCTARGAIAGQLVERSVINKSVGRRIGGVWWSAIQVTTAAGVAGVMELMRAGALPQRGFVRQDEVDLEAFMATEFGALYADGAITERRAAA